LPLGAKSGSRACLGVYTFYFLRIGFGCISGKCPDGFVWVFSLKRKLGTAETVANQILSKFGLNHTKLVQISEVKHLDPEK